MKVQFEEMFPWESAQAIAKAPICYLPLGVIEWHGEHNAVGLDAIKAHAVCVGERLLEIIAGRIAERARVLLLE